MCVCVCVCVCELCVGVERVQAGASGCHKTAVQRFYRSRRLQPYYNSCSLTIIPASTSATHLHLRRVHRKDEVCLPRPYFCITTHPSLCASVTHPTSCFMYCWLTSRIILYFCITTHPSLCAIVTHPTTCFMYCWFTSCIILYFCIPTHPSLCAIVTHPTSCFMYCWLTSCIILYFASPLILHFVQ